MIDRGRQPSALALVQRELTASLLVLTGLFLLELAQLSRNDAALDSQLVLWSACLLLALLAPLALIALLGHRIVTCRGSVGLLLTSLAFFLIAWPLGRDLSQGAGVQRKGWGVWVLLGTPLLVSILGAASLVVFRTFRNRSWALPATVCAVGAVGAREANSGVFVGLYPSLHDAAFGIEIVLWLIAVTLLLSKVRPGRINLAVVSMAVVLSGVGWVQSPPERVRASFSRHGLHSGRILRWRGRWISRPADTTVLVDNTLPEQVRSWRGIASQAAREFQQDREREGRPPLSLLWITIDTLRADRLTPELTPHLHALAQKSARFTHVYSQFPATHFSFGSMFHGRYPSATAFYRSLNGSEDRGLSLNEAFVESGFRTAASIGFTQEWLESPGFKWLLRSFEFVNHKRQGYPSYAGEHFVQSAEATLDEMVGERFFFWLHLMDPHHDYSFHEGVTQGNSLVARYEGEVRYADKQVGRILDYLKRTNRLESTVIVINSDHGEALGEHGGTYYHATSLLEEQVRVPLIVHVPGLPPLQSDAIVECVDLAETFQDILQPKRRFPTQGTSLLPLMISPETRSAWPNFAHSELPPTGTLTVVSPAAMLRVGDHKIIHHMEEAYTEIFNLKDDPLELNDLSATHGDRKQEMLAMLRGMQQWSHGFDRGMDPNVQRGLFLEQARRQIENSSNPMKRQQGLLLANRAQLTELAPLIEALGVDAGEEPELRIEALSAARRLSTGALEKITLSLAASKNDVLRWLALIEGKGVLDRTRPFSDPVFSLWQQICKDDSNRTGWGAEAQLALETLARPTASKLRRVHARRYLVATAKSRLEAAQLIRLLQESKELGITTDEQLDILAALWESDRSLWLDRALNLASNRYLKVPLKDRLLSRISDVPETIAYELSLRLLTGFEREFQDRMRRAVGEVLGAEAIGELESLQRRLNMAHEDRRGGRTDEMLRAYDYLVSTCRPPGCRLRFALDQVRLLLPVDHQRAAIVLKQMAPVASALLAGPDREWYASLLEDHRALAIYRPDLGPLPASSVIRFTEAQVLSGAEYFPGSNCLLSIGLDNQGARTFPRGPSRCRILWTREGTDDPPIYGTELKLSRDLLPKTSDHVSASVAVPEASGKWQGRLILSQHNHNRFHMAENKNGLIHIRVVDPKEAKSSLDADARSLFHQWKLSGQTLDRDLHDGSVLTWINTGFQQGLEGPLIELNGRDGTCRIRCSSSSTLPGGGQVMLFVIPDGTDKRIHVGSHPVPSGPDLQDLVIPVVGNLVPKGLYRPLLIVGPRPGVSRVASFQLTF